MPKTCGESYSARTAINHQLQSSSGPLYKAIYPGEPGFPLGILPPSIEEKNLCGSLAWIYAGPSHQPTNTVRTLTTNNDNH